MSVGILRTCLETYRELSRSGDDYLKAIAERLNIDKATLHRRLQRFESLIQKRGRNDFRLIKRGQGTKASPIRDDPKMEQIIGDLGQLLEAWDRIVTDWGVRHTIVRVGMSLTASRYFIPLLSRGFPEVDFDTTHSRPRRLIELEQKKACDLVLTVIPNDDDQIREYAPKRPGSLRWSRDMQLKVIAPRGHFSEVERVEINNRDDRIEKLWNRMAKEGHVLCLLRDEPERYPMTYLPSSELPPDLRIHRVGSTQMLEALVLSSDPEHQHVTVSLSNFLSGAAREKVHVLDAQLESVRIGLFRPMKSITEPENVYRTETIDRIEMRIIDELNWLIDVEDKVEWQEKYCFHVTKVDNRVVWVPGKIWWQIRPVKESVQRSEWTVSGIYMVAIGKETHKYLIRGRVLVKEEGHCHLVCRVTSIGEWFIDEFSISSVFPNEKLMIRGDITGIWSGTTAWNKNSARIHEDFRGCFVISSSKLKHNELETIAKKYKHEHKINAPVFSGAMLRRRRRQV